MKTEGYDERPQLEAMFECLRELIVDGLQHGFFDLTISCEMIEKRRRQLLIKAGKSHKFIIPNEDLN